MEKISIKEIESWIDKDDELYNWGYSWVKENKCTIKVFIKRHHGELLKYIKRKIK